jgi:glycerol-3-phosphate acyltransferase PlsX
MNIGSEDVKGHDLAKETNTLFNNSPVKDQFIGNIEGRDIFRGDADVIVCDGFVGNVVLKTCEGTVEYVMTLAKKEIMDSLGDAAGKAKEAFQRLEDRYHYSEQGGAPLLGIDGICIICHGASGDRAIKNALNVAATYAAAGLNELIVRELETSPLIGAAEED